MITIPGDQFGSTRIFARTSRRFTVRPFFQFFRPGVLIVADLSFVDGRGVPFAVTAERRF
jgi:hypothetical protein